MELPQGAVAVGVDGSDKDSAALIWGAAEATRRGDPLHLVWAFDVDGSRLGDRGVAVDVNELGADIVSQAVRRVRAGYPELYVATHCLVSDPASALVEASKTVSLVVVGARGLGRIAGRLLGSVSQKVTAHARCPVVVVHDRNTDDGPVVVGVEPGDVYDHVLETGFDHARRRGVGVRLVHASPPDAMRVDIAVVREALEAAAAERVKELQALADEWRGRHPDVPVEYAVIHNHPVNALTEESDSAAMLIVGSRGRRGLTGTRLGSVARGVLHEAPVVMVVPVEPD